MLVKLILQSFETSYGEIIALERTESINVAMGESDYQLIKDWLRNNDIQLSDIVTESESPRLLYKP